MAFKRSTGLRNALLEKKVEMEYAKTHKCSSLDFVESGSSSSGSPEIQNSASDGVDYTSMFVTGDQVVVSSSSSNDQIFTITNIPSSTRLEVDKPVTAETGQTAVLSVANGGSYKDLLQNGVLVIFSGSQPASADNDESGFTQLCQITVGSGSFTPGNGANGLNFGSASSGTLSKDPNETWSGVNDADGTAGWFRFYANDKITGADSSAIRFDGSIATSGAELNMSNTSFSSGATTTLNSFDITLPSS